MTFESALRSDRDMTDVDNAKEAAWRLDACRTAEDYQAWALAYGRALCESAGTADLSDELAAAKDEISELNRKVSKADGIHTHIERLIQSLDEKANELAEVLS